MSYFTHTNTRSGNFCEPSVGIPGGVNICAHPPVILYKHCVTFIFTYKMPEGNYRVEPFVLMTAGNALHFTPWNRGLIEIQGFPMFSITVIYMYLSIYHV